MLPKRALKISSIALLSLFALAAGAVFWVDIPCSDPSCARARYSLFVELDSFRDIDAIPLELDSSGRAVSARSILASGGIDVSIERDDDALPYDPESGPLDRADLYQYSLAWRNRAVPSNADAQIYAVITPALVSDRGEPLFGLMFDGAGREGIAVAPLQTVRTFQRTSPDSIPALQLRTFMHEMLHALNRRHLDAAQMRDGRITLEAPTRCLARQENGQWILAEEPLLALSPATIRFFQTAAPRDILPGGANTPFEGMRSSATECEDARANAYDALANSRWEFAKQRFLGLLGVGSASAQEIEEVEQEPPQVSLRVQAQEAPYPLGYPIAIRIMAENQSKDALPIKERLAPPYGLIQVQYRFKDEEEWQSFQPIVWFEPAEDETAQLEPGAHTEQTAPIYFGDAGWTFPEPGEYELRASLKPSEDANETLSNVITIRIEAPQTDEERAVLQSLLDSDGALDADMGRLLVFGGRIGDVDARAPLENAVAQHAESALGSALKLTLASQRLSPTINPNTGERPSPAFADAETLLADTCTDSGIAALKHELLKRFEPDLPQAMKRRPQSSAEAWDGTAPEGQIIATYSDPSLERFGDSIHFCQNDWSIKSSLRARASQLAGEIKRTTAKRIIVVGHADASGTCAFNDALALKRAESVKQLLRRAGIRSDQIRTVSLGERRPVSFSNTDEARLWNRRVEILLEDDDEEDGSQENTEEQQRLLPKCE